MKPTRFPKLIQSERIYFKALDSDDAEKIFKLISSERKYIGEFLEWVDNIRTIEDEVKYVKTQTEAAKDLLGFDWCIYENSTSKFLGYIGTDPVTFELFKDGKFIDWDNGIISFAYFLKQEANGNGYMTEALGKMRDIAIELGFSRVEINSEVENIKSQNVAKRCGFIHDDEDFGKMYYLS